MKMQYFIAGMRNATPSNTATNYTSLYDQNDGTWYAAGNESTASVRMAAEGYLKQFSYFITTAPGVGLSRTFSIMIDGVESFATRVTFSGTTNGWQTVTLSIPVWFGKGSTLSIQATVTGGTATSAGKNMWHATVASHCYSFGARNATTSSTTLTEYMNPMGGQSRAWTVNGADWEMVVPCDGTISTFYADSVGGTVGASGSYTLTVQKNGVDTALSCTIVANTSSASDLTNSFTVAAGDKLVIKKVPTLTPTARGFKVAMRFVPSTFGNFFTGMGSNSSPSLTATQYQSPIGHGNYTWGSVELTMQQGLPSGVTSKALYVSIPTAPSTGKSWVIRQRQNAINAGSSVTIADTAKTGNSSASTFTTAANDLVNYSATPSGTPTGPGGFHISTLWSMSSITEDIVNFAGAECAVVTAPQYAGADTINGTASTPNSPMAYGGKAFRVNPTTTGTGSFLFSQYGQNGKPQPEGLDAETVYYEFRFRYATASSDTLNGGEQILDCRVPGASKGYVTMNSDGRLYIWDSTASLVYLTSGTLAPNTDYVIGFKLGNGSVAPYELRVDGVVWDSGTLNAGTTRHYGLRIGKVTNYQSTSVDYYYDDVVISDTGFGNGKYRVTNAFPNATDSMGTWTAGTGTKDWQEVDDYSDSASYNKTNSAGQFTLDMQNRSDIGIPNASVVAIKPMMVVRADTGTGSGNVDLVVKTTSGGVALAAGSTETYTTTETALQWCYEYILGTAFTAWSNAEYDDLKLGLLTNAGGLRNSSLWSEVLYISGGSGNLLLLGVG